MIILLFIHPQIVSNLYEFLSSAKHKRRYFEEVFFIAIFINVITFYFKHLIFIYENT